MNEVLDLQSLQEGKHILWGGATSGYSAKLRAYLIKKDIDYVELHPSHPHFKEVILPKIGHFTLPVWETPEGNIVADSTEAMEYLETLYPERPMLPENKTLAAVAQIIHSYGSDGLIKAMMYYRWDSTHANRCYVMDEFSRLVFRKEERSPQATYEFSKQFRGYLHHLGVRSDHMVDIAIETSSDKLYGILNEHFLEYPYLLGGLPSMADFGLIMGLHPHQGRDPFTSGDLKSRAPALFRWMETMHRKAIIDPEVYHVPQAFFTPEQIPKTLKDLLELIFADYGTEIQATANSYHDWLDAADRPAGTIISHDCQKSVHQIMGEISYRQQGATITRKAFLDCLTHHQRLVAVIETMDDAERDEFQALTSATGGNEIVDIRLQRPMARDNYAHVVK